MPQQRQHERKHKQRGHTLPEQNRVAFQKRPRPADRMRRARRSGFHLDGKFDHIAITFVR